MKAQESVPFSRSRFAAMTTRTPGEELDGVGETRQHPHVETQGRSEPDEEHGEEGRERPDEGAQFPVEKEEAGTAEGYGNEAGRRDEHGLGAAHLEPGHEAKSRLDQIERKEQHAPDEGRADRQDVLRGRVLAEQGVVVGQIEIAVEDEGTREREVVEPVGVERSRVPQVQEGGEQDQGQKRPALAPRAPLAQERAPDRRHRHRHQGRLKERNSGLEAGSDEVGRDEGERQQGETEAAVHQGFHYTFGRHEPRECTRRRQ